ncbi:hypothetical protein JVU11DRAFT_4729 [Chiua virens]|nr:hypothetical protein JVU11DRAFT_4729 [Chiua virens]
MAHKKKTSLKATLQSQQSRLRAKAKAEHYCPDRILLLGEGNFSFARALVVDAPPSLAHLIPGNVTATSYDSEEACFAKYPDAAAIVHTIRQRGVHVVFDVDATKLQRHSALKGKRWDRIVWNFPHAGKGITDQDRNILSNQRLILDFLRAAPQCLTLGPIPAIHPALKRKRQDDDDEEEDNISGSEMEMRNCVDHTPKRSAVYFMACPIQCMPLRFDSSRLYRDVPRLAKSPPKTTKTGEEPNPRYKLLRSFVFHRDLWKGYEHRMTKGERAHGHGKPGKGGEDRTWEFCLQE